MTHNQLAFPEVTTLDMLLSDEVADLMLSSHGLITTARDAPYTFPGHLEAHASANLTTHIRQRSKDNCRFPQLSISLAHNSDSEDGDKPVLSLVYQQLNAVSEGIQNLRTMSLTIGEDYQFALLSDQPVEHFAGQIVPVGKKEASEEQPSPRDCGQFMAKIVDEIEKGTNPMARPKLGGILGRIATRRAS